MTINAASAGPKRRGLWWIAAVGGVVALGLVARLTLTTGPAHPAQSATRDGATDLDPLAADAQVARLEREIEAANRSGHAAATGVEQAARLVRDYPRHAGAQALHARALALAGHHAQAYEACQRALALAPRHAPTHALAGRLAQRLGKVEPALRHYSDAVDLDNTRPEYRFGLAQAYLDHRDRDRARRTVIDAMQIAPNAHEGYAVLAELFAQENKLTMAIEKMAKAVSLAPREQTDLIVAYTRREAALLRRNNQPQAALTTLQRLGPSAEAPAELIEDHATCLAMMGQPDQAAELYEQAAKARPGEPALREAAERWRHKAQDKK